MFLVAACTARPDLPAAVTPVELSTPTASPTLPQPLTPDSQPVIPTLQPLTAPPVTLAADPHDRRMVYALLADETLWRTTDRGQTWEQLPLPVPSQRFTPGDSTRPNRLAFQSQPDLRLFADAPGRLMVRAASTLYASDDGGMTWRPLLEGVSVWTADEDKGQFLATWPSLWSSLAEGLYVSQDGGDTWQQRYEGDFPGALVLNLVADPARPADLWAGTTEGPWRSQDGGRTWQPVQAGLENVLDSYLFTAAGGRLYALTKGESNQVILVEWERGEGNGAADSWQALTGNLVDFTNCHSSPDPLIPADFCQLYAFLPDPGTPAWLYLAAEDGLLISEDGGRSWRAYLPGRGAVYRIAAVGGNLTLFYLWTDVGLVVTNDPGVK
ncbi:MAG: hypothetical protein AB1791_02370 [Chloroflexota bacterium]